MEYWIIPPVFVDEICKGFDKRKVCEVLHGIQWLKRDEKDKGWQVKRRLGERQVRFYVLVGIAPPEPPDSE
ncbi:MAG: hypothetical protein Q4A06_06255 [Cardiobacteriaceae bacterium]|nr:hypothetical protein [Cardiobacteriaceae bacterium]